MIVGNHSAGKSSFINWYIGEQIQKTGVAIEVGSLLACTWLIHKTLLFYFHWVTCCILQC